MLFNLPVLVGLAGWVRWSSVTSVPASSTWTAWTLHSQRYRYCAVIIIIHKKKSISHQHEEQIVSHPIVGQPLAVRNNFGKYIFMKVIHKKQILAKM